MTDAPSEIVERVYKLRPERGDVVAVHVSDDDLADPNSDAMLGLQQQLGHVAKDTGATFVLLSETTRLEQLDEATMAAGGWIRVHDGVMQALGEAARRRARTRRATDTAATVAAHGGSNGDDETKDGDDD